MSSWQRGLIMAMSLLFVFTGVFAQAPPDDPQRQAQEKEAADVYTQGEGCMKVASYEDAVTQFQNILKRYPNTQVRYKAQFRLADAYVALKQTPDALEQLQSVVREESTDWSPQALMKIGDIFVSEQKYTEAFRAYRQVVTDYSDSPMVDHAYYAIGVAHFRLAHYDQAATELAKVGTAYASRFPEFQRVAPGDPLYVRLREPNLVSAADSRIPVTVTSAKSGDSETTSLIPEAEGSEYYSLAISTALGDGKPGDGLLQVYGNDTVTLAYKSRYAGEGAVGKTVSMAIATNARLTVRDSNRDEIQGAVVGDTITIEAADPDRDQANDPDIVAVEIKTKAGDTEKLTLTETGKHTGIFKGTIIIKKAEPAPDSGALETMADIVQGSANQLDDKITITYLDEINLAVQQAPGPIKVSKALSLFTPSNAILVPVEAKPPTATLEITSLVYKGRSLTEIAATYSDLGQEGKAANTFRKAAEQFQELIARYPEATEVEDAMYGLFKIYVAQGQYDAAVAMVAQISQRFPQSSSGTQALFELAALHIKREEYDRALGIYQGLLQRTKGTPLAEEAQYAICTTYVEMIRPKAGRAAAPVSREQVAAALEDFSRTYPNSDRTPDALFQLVNFRYSGEDYRGTVDAARRMVAMFPDHVMTGRVLLLQAKAQVKMKDLNSAVQTLTSIIANYGDVSAEAEQLLATLRKSAAKATPTGGNQ